MPPFQSAVVPAMALFSALFSMTPTMAQTVGQVSGQRQEAPVRVQTTFNFFVPGPSGDSAEAQKSRDTARRAIYEMAGRECDLLREVLAKDCRMESVQSNIGRQPYGQQQPEGYSVNGSMSFQITVK